MAPAAWAVAYTFPGNMPSGCLASATAGVYNCAAVTLQSADTVTINSPKPATITATSFDAHGAKINAAGTAADLTINVTGGGVFSNSNGSVVNANLTAGYISSGGTVSFGGSLTANSSYVSIGGAVTVGGPISAKSYVFIGNNASRNTINGSITATINQVDIYNSDVYGSITAGSNVNLTTNTAVTGSLTANGTYIDTHSGAVIGGSLTAASHIDIHDGASIGGSMTAGTYISMTNNSVIQGNATAGTGTIALNSGSIIYGNATSGGNMTVYSGATVAQCARSTGATHIYNYSGSSIGGACCGSIGTCTNTCVHFTPKPSACQTLHHIELTTTSNSAAAGASVVYAIKACADAVSPCSPYTWGVTGTLSISGVMPTYVTGASFSIPSGSSSVTETVQMTPGTATASVVSPNPMPTTTPSVFCGMGVAAAPGSSCDVVVSAPLHHLEITTPAASGLTCAAADFTIKACADGATPCTDYTSGVSGNLVLTGTGGSTTAFSINSGTSTTTLSKQITKVGTVTASIGSPSPEPTNSPANFCGMGTIATSGGSCAYSTATSALSISNLANHVANVPQVGVLLKAIKSNADNTACVPGFVGVKSINFSCAYLNPDSGSKAVALGATTSLACGNGADGPAQATSLIFDGTGMAATSVQYADVGQVRLTASYTGAAGVDSDVSGVANFIAAPAAFAVTPPMGPIAAGNAFSTTITAQIAGGGPAMNFGKESSPESATLTWARVSPIGPGSSDGVFSLGTLGSFSSGVATATGMSWTEVGTGTLSATLTSGGYLGSTLTATGSTLPGSVGLFMPHHFQVDVNNGCGSQFTYSGQPFGVVVTAVNKNGGTTVNYDGGGALSSITAAAITLSAVSNGSTGSLVNTVIAKSKLSLGKATVAAGITSPTFTFNTKPYVPTTVTLRAIDANGVSSSGYTEGGVNLRSGRIKVSNKFGASGTSLSVPVQTQYWAAVSSNAGAATWVVNDKDSCTVVPTTAVAIRGYYSSNGSSTSAWPVTASAFNLKSPGNFELVLTKSNANVTGSVDFAIALGNTAVDQSCLNPTISASGATTGAGLPWLRAQYGSTHGCTGNTAYNRDPSARATFGVFSPESQKAVHVQDIY